jgi:hypothetical protein
LAKRFNSQVAATLQRLREGDRIDASRSPKVAEFDLLASGRPKIGGNRTATKLYAETLPRFAWDDGSFGLDLRFIRSLVAVHRSRE